MSNDAGTQPIFFQGLSASPTHELNQLQAKNKCNVEDTNIVNDGGKDYVTLTPVPLGKFESGV